MPTPHGGPWKPLEGWLVEPLLRYEATVTMPTMWAPAQLVRDLRFDEQLPLAGLRPSDRRGRIDS